MPGELEGFKQGAETIMRILQIMVLCDLLLLGFGQKSRANEEVEQEEHCFRIRVQLNKQRAPSPTAITFQTEHGESTVHSQDGCFRLPKELVSKDSLDLHFEIPRNRIYLSRIASGFFAGAWDIELADKKFEKDVTLPQHARPKDACVVVFHIGEPETRIVQTGCRTTVRRPR
jgi:hypothetical protein